MFKVIVAVVGLAFSNSSVAACFIDEVVELYDEELTRKEIREECDNEVLESKCSITRIYRYAERDKSLSYILRRCESFEDSDDSSNNRNQYQAPSSSPATICATTYGLCRMSEAIPKGVSCYCQTYSGQVWGLSQ